MKKKAPLAGKNRPAKKEKKESPFPVVAIGASAGGLEAFSLLLESLSERTGMAFIYVQHLRPDHKSVLTEILSKKTKMKVQTITDMELMKPNNIYSGNHNLNLIARNLRRYQMMTKHADFKLSIG